MSAIIFLFLCEGIKQVVLCVEYDNIKVFVWKKKRQNHARRHLLVNALILYSVKDLATYNCAMNVALKMVLLYGKNSQIN